MNFIKALEYPRNLFTFLLTDADGKFVTKSAKEFCEQKEFELNTLQGLDFALKLLPADERTHAARKNKNGQGQNHAMQFRLWPLRTLIGDIQFDLFPARAAMQQHTGSMSAGQHYRKKSAAPRTLKPFLICLHFTTNLRILQQFSFPFLKHLRLLYITPSQNLARHRAKSPGYTESGQRCCSLHLLIGCALPQERKAGNREPRLLLRSPVGGSCG